VLIALIPAAGMRAACATPRGPAGLAEMHLRFVAGVSHEMRTPLAVIRGAGQNMATGVCARPRTYRALRSDDRQARGPAWETIEQVLMFAAAQNMKTHATDTVSVAGALDDAVDASFMDLPGIRNASFACGFDPELPHVLGDSAALRMAFQNLITNAARHGGAGGLGIAISAEALDIERAAHDGRCG